MRFSTSTCAGGGIVPWLAADGPLSYSPMAPPDRDYFFQYGWIVPGIFAAETNKRSHFWFGNPRKSDPRVQRLFRFWNLARRGEYDALYLSNGIAAPATAHRPLWHGPKRASSSPDDRAEASPLCANSSEELTAPRAAFLHKDMDKQRLIIMQHGSYHIGDIASQPRIDRGEAVLYRGVQHAETYLLYRLTTADTHRRLMSVHAQSLTDSVVSFNAAHCNLMRCETGYLNDGSFLFDSLGQEAGLDPDDPVVRSWLYSGYALEEWCGAKKFGPHFVKFRTPLTNLRITTFVANETEVKVIDPNKLEVVEAAGCKVREVCV